MRVSHAREGGWKGVWGGDHPVSTHVVSLFKTSRGKQATLKKWSLEFGKRLACIRTDEPDDVVELLALRLERAGCGWGRHASSVR
jgi:hypothetical protein